MNETSEWSIDDDIKSIERAIVLLKDYILYLEQKKHGSIGR